MEAEQRPGGGCWAPDGRGERQVSKVSLELAGPKGVRKAVRRVGDPGPQMPAVNLRRGPLQGSELSAHIQFMVPEGPLQYNVPSLSSEHARHCTVFPRGLVGC